MFKKIILSFFILIFSLITNVSFADSVPVEEVFSDINKGYKYYNELQALYDKGMISPDSNGRFNPSDLLNRDEFVGIMMESTCRECIKPDVSLDYLQKYENSDLFFDLQKDNKYFYCVAGAKDEKIVKGYHEGTKCENGTNKDGEIPFCPENTIILEEALAIILRASGIMTENQANQILLKIANGEITKKLSNDVGPLNLDGSVYSFYPYLQKALEYEIVEFDINGNEKKYNLLKLKDGNIYPKKAMTKQDFLEIAYVTLKANSCQNKKEENLALKFTIYEKTCSENIKENCRISDLRDQNNTYDFNGDVISTCSAGVSDESYIWRFYNVQSGEEIKRYGKYIDDYRFLKTGKYKVFLRIIDKCGNTGEVYKDLIINDDGRNLNLNIDAEPISGKGPLKVDFVGNVTGGKGPYKYTWDFGDGNKAFGKEVPNIYKNPGSYNVELIVEDSLGNKIKGNILINVVDDDENIYSDTELINTNDNSKDSDGDGLDDTKDLCPLIKGDPKNLGCPINEISCNSNSDCNEGYSCNSKNYCEPNQIKTSCEYSGGDLVFGNAICNSCPCDNFLDFNATLRKCDVIFPAITSPDQTKIYGKGELFQIK